MKKSDVLGFVCPNIALVSEWRVYQAQEGMQGNKHRGQCVAMGDGRILWLGDEVEGLEKQ